MSRDTSGAEIGRPTDTPPGLRQKIAAFGEAIEELAGAAPFAKPRYQTQVHRLAGELLDSDDGVRALLDAAPRYTEAGTFHAGPWEHASRLLPRLVGYSLRGEGVYPTLEALSELRMLSIAIGTHQEEGIDAEGAEQFLREVCVDNLDLMFPEASEESRQRPRIYARAQRLFDLIRENISITGFGVTLIDELSLIHISEPTRPY